MIKILKKLFHIHYYSKVVISRYTSFNFREVIVECKCGDRKIKKVSYDSIHPFPTASEISQKNFNKYLFNKKYPYISKLDDNSLICSKTYYKDVDIYEY